MKIVHVAGAPGSGKSEIAAAIAAKTGIADVHDGYAKTLARRVGIKSFSINSTYLANLMIAFKRMELEQNAVKLQKDIVVVGSSFDSLAYEAVNIEYIRGFFGPDGADERYRVALATETNAGVVLGSLIRDMWTSTLLYYKPLDHEGATDDQIVYDASLRIALEKWKPICVELPVDTAEAVAHIDEKVIDEIDEAERQRAAWEAAQPEVAVEA